MFSLLISLAILALVWAFKPDFFVWVGYKLRYWRNRFYRDALNKCPYCKEELSRTSAGRGICTTDGCNKR